MGYPFPPDILQLLSQQMAAGNYHNEDDLLRDALKAFAGVETVAYDPIVAEGIRQGLADVEAGRVRPYSEFVAEIAAKHNFRILDE